MSKQTWSISESERQVHTLTIPNLAAGEEFKILFQTDEHWDNAHCVLPLLKQHHEEAQEINAPVMKFGDIFCAMQGKWDKRSDQSQLRDEHRGNSYLDKLVNTAVDWYGPYAPQIALVCPGNHETAISNHHQTNLIDRFHQGLSRLSSVPKMGGYWGFVRVNTEDGYGFDVNYHHGYGGGGEVTRGLIDNNRTRGQYTADVFVSGHIHRRNMEENIMTELSKGKIVRKKQLFLRCPSYKDEHSDAPTGWHASGGRAARPLGAWWLICKLKRTAGGGKYLDFTPLAAD